MLKVTSPMLWPQFMQKIITNRNLEKISLTAFWEDPSVTYNLNNYDQLARLCARTCERRVSDGLTIVTLKDRVKTLNSKLSSNRSNSMKIFFLGLATGISMKSSFDLYRYLTKKKQTTPSPLASVSNVKSPDRKPSRCLLKLDDRLKTLNTKLNERIKNLQLKLNGRIMALNERMKNLFKRN